MSASTWDRLRPQTVVGTSLAVAAVGAVGYCLYFDHRRRTDPAFRRKLLSQQRKLEQSAKAESVRARDRSKDELLRLLEEPTDGPPPPQAGPEAAEAYFLSEVAAGEQLTLSGPSKYAEAAVHFFRALSVYPAPTELMGIYRKTQPPEVVELIEQAVAQGIRSSSRGGRGSSGATIEELAEPSPRSRTASSTGSSPQSGTGNGSYVQVQRADASA